MDKNEVYQLKGFCPECREYHLMMSGPSAKFLASPLRYHRFMVASDRSVAKCEGCGAFFTAFVVVPYHVFRL